MDSLVKRIGYYSEVDSHAFESIKRLTHKIETRSPGQEIVVEGEHVDFVFVVVSGWAIRFRMLDDGRRQILNFMLPGDCFDLMAIGRARSDHSVSAASDVTLRRIRADDFMKTISNDPQLATSFWWAAIQEEAILREQIVRVGRRTARERVGHLILELNRRVAAVTGELSDHLALPVPQSLFADALGLSIVHVSRTLSRLKADGLVRTTRAGIEIMNRNKLSELCDFDSRYLHLEKLKFKPYGRTTPD